ncbi:MAG: hydrogenase formation protein HypD [Actinomycetia bacterium]|nr:hydrogenase formation protein HypD [Actinomycetes bacterium]MCP4962150.1 hydrogenase formation protein HypD [Actinomycetes bacterium]
MSGPETFRDADLARRLLTGIGRVTTRPWSLMEVCGGQTHSIVRNGLDQLLPEEIRLVHGPGCPVCVTPISMIEAALHIASLPGVVFCTFGDMLRVPATESDLMRKRSEGADVRVVYSPMDALKLAEELPDSEIVFFGVGFETTAPANAMAIETARSRGITNFSVLVSHVLVPPAIAAIASSPTNQIDAFLAAGHVCTVMGTTQYEPLVERFNVPIVVTGFEALDLLEGIRRAVVQLEAGEARVENAYTRMVKPEGNRVARDLLDRVFEPCDRAWRGMGELPASGWRLTETFRDFDAEVRFDVPELNVPESPDCRAGEVLQGIIKPNECPAFGIGCTPRRPLGAPMVSSEGACAAYFRYRPAGVSGG